MENNFDSLQLFAEGISGEGNAAAAGQQAAGASPARAKEAQAAAAKPPRLSWAQILADPEYNREMQKTVSARLKAAQKAWEKRNRQPNRPVAPPQAPAPAAQRNAPVSKPNSAPVGKPTAAPVAQPVRQVRKGFANRPQGSLLPGDRVRAGIPNGPLSRRPFPGKAGVSPIRSGDNADGRLRQHFASLVAQENRLRQVFPDFSLQQALKNPTFVHLTAPHVGVSVENAYYLCNRRQHQARAMQLAARKTAEKLSNAIRSGTYRPVENGTAAQAPTVTAFDYTHATAQQRLALKNAIRRSASRGEKLYPTDIR